VHDGRYKRLFHQFRLRREGERDTGKIDLAGHERRHDAVDRAFGEPHFDFGKLLMKSGDDAWQDHRDPHRAGADTQHAGDALLECADLGQSVPVFKLHQLDAARQHLALLGQRHAGRQPLEQRYADRLFQLPDAAGQRRLADVQRLGGSGDIPLLDDAQEMTKQPRMHG
jgi:hypothetical protein